MRGVKHLEGNLKDDELRAALPAFSRSKPLLRKWGRLVARMPDGGWWHFDSEEEFNEICQSYSTGHGPITWEWPRIESLSKLRPFAEESAFYTEVPPRNLGHHFISLAFPKRGERRTIQGQLVEAAYLAMNYHKGIGGLWDNQDEKRYRNQEDIANGAAEVLRSDSTLGEHVLLMPDYDAVSNSNPCLRWRMYSVDGSLLALMEEGKLLRRDNIESQLELAFWEKVAKSRRIMAALESRPFGLIAPRIDADVLNGSDRDRTMMAARKWLVDHTKGILSQLSRTAIGKSIDFFRMYVYPGVCETEQNRRVASLLKMRAVAPFGKDMKSDEGENAACDVLESAVAWWLLRNPVLIDRDTGQFTDATIKRELEEAFAEE